MVERGGLPAPEGENQRPQFGDRLPQRRGKPYPAAHMFPDSADLPIFSGTPIPAVERPFVPEDHSHKQTTLPGMPDIDYDHILGKDKQLRHRRGGAEPPSEEGTLWKYEEPPAGASLQPEPEDDQRRQQLGEALQAYNLNVEELRNLVNLGTDLNKALRTGNAPPEVLHLLTLMSVILRLSPREQIKSPADAVAVLMAEMGHLDQEELRTVLLDTKSRVQDITTVYRGSLNASMVRVGEVFKEAIRINSAALIVAHNHPSGDPTPSPVIWRM
jgi:hypothetical protein